MKDNAKLMSKFDLVFWSDIGRFGKKKITVLQSYPSEVLTSTLLKVWELLELWQLPDILQSNKFSSLLYCQLSISSVMSPKGTIYFSLFLCNFFLYHANCWLGSLRDWSSSIACPDLLMQRTVVSPFMQLFCQRSMENSSRC